MTKVSLKGMQFYAFHGYYDFERRVGNSFLLDVEVDVDLDHNPLEQIEKTINYETIYSICATFMRMKYRLLESLAYDIAQRIKEDLELAQGVRVTLSKLRPPLPGKVDRSEIVVQL